MMRTAGARGGLWRRLWRTVDTVRRTFFNLLFLGLLAVLLLAVLRDDTPSVGAGSALWIAPLGVLSDQSSPVDPLLFWLAGDAQPLETTLADQIDAIDRAATDPRIPMLILQLRDLHGGGLSKLQELAAAILRFRATGKPVVAIGDAYTQDQYFLAAHADEIIMAPMGAVQLEGYAVYQNYFREALDRLAIDVNVFRVGEYKSAVEPFTRNDMSEAARSASEAWLEDLWQQYLQGVAAQRGVSAEQLAGWVNSYPARLAAHGGDAARTALEAGLVDRLASRPAVNRYLQGRLGATPDDGFPAIDVASYLAATEPEPEDGPEVGLIVASGMILDGEQPLGSVGGDTVAALLRHARLDSEVRAVVFRIDSGGGSAHASEVIRQEMLELKRAGKPVVVSMGSVAASGGYWIAADADQIWATPASLTGSIGIFAALPSVDRSLQKLGIHTDGTGTTAMAGGFRVDRPLSDAHRAVIQQELDRGYRQFIELVAYGRDMPPERVEHVAQGRVWSGTAARDVGLVDQIGGLRDAQRAAAELAGLETWRLRLIEPPMSPQERLLRELSGISARIWSSLTGVALPPQAPGISAFSILQPSGTGLAATRPVSAGGAVVHDLWRQYRRSLEMLGNLNDPRGFYLWCGLCTAP